MTVTWLGDRVRSRWLRLGWLIPTGWVSLVACGGIAVIDPVDGTGGAGGTDSASTGTTSTSGVTVATATTSTGGMGDADVRIEFAFFSADCMPAVPPDPLAGSMGLFVDNSAGAQAVLVDVLAARLESPQVGLTSFDMEPVGGQLVMPGNGVVVEFAKVPNSATGESGCGWCMATDAIIVVELSVAGNIIEMAAPVDSIGCVF